MQIVETEAGETFFYMTLQYDQSKQFDNDKYMTSYLLKIQIMDDSNFNLIFVHQMS